MQRIAKISSRARDGARRPAARARSESVGDAAARRRRERGLALGGRAHLGVVLRDDRGPRADLVVEPVPEREDDGRHEDPRPTSPAADCRTPRSRRTSCASSRSRSLIGRIALVVAVVERHQPRALEGLPVAPEKRRDDHGGEGRGGDDEARPRRRRAAPSRSSRRRASSSRSSAGAARPRAVRLLDVGAQALQVGDQRHDLACPRGRRARPAARSRRRSAAPASGRGRRRSRRRPACTARRASPGRRRPARPRASRRGRGPATGTRA